MDVISRAAAHCHVSLFRTWSQFFEGLGSSLVEIVPRVTKYILSLLVLAIKVQQRLFRIQYGVRLLDFTYVEMVGKV